MAGKFILNGESFIDAIASPQHHHFTAHATHVVMCWLAWIWPISRYLLLSPVIGYGIFGLLMAWSLWYRAKKIALAKSLGIVI